MDIPDSNTPPPQNLITTRPASADIVLSEADADAIQAAADSALAPATRRAYRSLWQGFDRWCQARGYDALPAAAVAVAAIMEHGRWQSSMMPARYTRHASAAQSAMAKLYAQGG